MNRIKQSRIYAVVPFFVFFLSISPLPAGDAFSLPDVVDVRSRAMGGVYSCDFDSPYILLVNPAGTAASGKKILFPSVAVDAAGPLDKLSSIYSEGVSSGNFLQSAYDHLMKYVSEHNGGYLNVDMMLPVNFARINNNSGFGFFNRVYFEGNIPSVTKADIAAGAEIQLVWAGAVPLIKSKNHLLAVGTGTRLVGRMEGVHTGIPSDIMDFSFSDLPVSGTVAAGFDAGIIYSFMNLIRVSAVWHSMYAGIQSSLGTFSDMSLTGDGTVPELFLEPGKLTLGTAVSFPTFFTKGVISSWTVYLDMRDALPFFTAKEDILSSSPLLSLAAGMEIVIFKTIALRGGICGPYLAAGAGIDLTPLHLEFAIYGKELGLEPGVQPQLHGAFSLSLYY